MEADSNKTTGLNRLLIWGWAIYAVSFILPMKDLDMWGYDAFWMYFKGFFAFEQKGYLSVLPVNLSNLAVILSPLLLRVLSARVLGVLLLLGGLHNTRFLWEICDDLSDLTNLFPAYYVWWLSFFVTGAALWRAPALRT